MLRCSSTLFSTCSLRRISAAAMTSSATQTSSSTALSASSRRNLTVSSPSLLPSLCFASRLCSEAATATEPSKTMTTTESSSNNNKSSAVVDPSAGDSHLAACTRLEDGTWSDEPALDELDLSIPQVNCAFVADLIARRKAEQRKQWGDVVDSKKKKKGESAVEEEGKEGGEKNSTSVATEEDNNKNNKESKSEQEGEEGEEEEEEGDFLPNLALNPSDGILLLDVRTVAEVESWGTIEGAKICPMHEFWEAVHLPADVFFEQYGFELPSKDRTILFFCHHGPRSLMAAQIAHHLGWKNVLQLRNGYYEWAKQFSLLCRRWMVQDHTTGIDTQRLTEFAAAREIAKDIAPEFNELVEEETEMIRIDHTRSLGSRRKLEMPESIKLLSAEFEAERDQLELEDSERSERFKAKLLEAGTPEERSKLLDDASVEAEKKNVAVEKGFDPVLSAEGRNVEDLEEEERLVRRDYSSEAARILRRKKAGERTGVPDSYFFRKRNETTGV